MLARRFTQYPQQLRQIYWGALLHDIGKIGIPDDSGQHKIVNGVAIYLGVMPSEMILGHAEAEMHGGVPAGDHQYHVLVSLFDNATGKRITNAQVKANVYEIGLSGVQKKLEPMLTAGTISYGNYFNMAGANPYRILVQIRLPGSTGAIEAEFEYRHARV